MNIVNLVAAGILLACGVNCAKAQTWTDVTDCIVNLLLETGTTAETVAGYVAGSDAGYLTGIVANDLTGSGWGDLDGRFCTPFCVS